MVKESMKLPAAGQLATRGYVGEMIKFPIDNQFLSDDLWQLVVNQFRLASDTETNGWRGEFWGKFMRAASLTFRATGSSKLYSQITESVKEMLATAGKGGRFSTYSLEKEFSGWDMWSRKYVMLGFLYYLEICKSDALKKRIVKALKKHADYIMKHVGDGKGKKHICDTTYIYGGMNSCSILEPFVKLYEITGESRYLDFSEYIISTGFSKDQNIIELAKNKSLYPYEFKHTKAYEMMSCFEGLLEYYKIKGKAEDLQAVINFVDMVLESDFTVIGSSGCTHELFDHSSVKQTEPAEKGVMQETCVTVTLMKLCAKLLLVTGDSKYADAIERSGYNALFGAVNSEHQTMKNCPGNVWTDEGLTQMSHEPFAFDSYSPLYYDRRAKLVGGFMMMQDGKSCGCCVSIGGAGTAIFGLVGITQGENGYYVNLYYDNTYTDKNAGVKIAVKANLYKKGEAKITVKSGEKITLRLRVPQWANGFALAVNGEKADYQTQCGYAVLTVSNGDKITVSMPMRVKRRILNGKVEFERGPVVLARDERFAEDITLPLNVPKKDGGAVAKAVVNEDFYNNVTLKIKTKNGEATFCDYSSAGKNYDSDNCMITVWSDLEK